MKQVEISYQTLVVPPPFAFAYVLNLDFEEDKVHINYELEFLNRDQITQEEIEAEGYSENDDFNWKGTLGKVWVDYLMEDIMNMHLEEESEDLSIYLHADIRDGENHESGLAVYAEDWDYRLQGLIQAIYEKSKVEERLILDILHIDSQDTQKYRVKGSFEHLQAKVNGNPIPWEALQQMMAAIYTIDFEGEVKKTPTTPGLWIDPDGSSGYQLFDEQAGESASKLKKEILTVLENSKS